LGGARTPPLARRCAPGRLYLLADRDL